MKAAEKHVAKTESRRAVCVSISPVVACARDCCSRRTAAVPPRSCRATYVFLQKTARSYPLSPRMMILSRALLLDAILSTVASVNTKYALQIARSLPCVCPDIECTTEPLRMGYLTLKILQHLTPVTCSGMPSPLSARR